MASMASPLSIRTLLPEPLINITIYCDDCTMSLTPTTSKKVQHLSPLLIIIVAILGALFLIVSYYTIIVRYCANRRNSRAPQAQVEDDSESHEEFVGENHGPVVDHPIWYIRTVGLAESVIEAIGVVKYKKGEGLIEGTDCSVCLSEFEEDEALRLLPKCDHAFHLPCIDTWLRSHTNCPSCRAPVVASPAVAVEPVSGSGEEGDLENSVSGGLESDENGEGSGVSDLSVRVEDGKEESDQLKDIEIPKKGFLSSLERPQFRVFSDLSDNHRVAQNGRQPPRRSVSMDLNPASIFCFSVANSLPLEEDVGSSSVPLEKGKTGNSSPGPGRLMGSSSKGRLLPKGHVSMERSFSSGGKLFLSRSSRNRGSILPICRSICRRSEGFVGSAAVDAMEFITVFLYYLDRVLLFSSCFGQ